MNRTHRWVAWFVAADLLLLTGGAWWWHEAQRAPSEPVLIADAPATSGRVGASSPQSSDQVLRIAPEGTDALRAALPAASRPGSDLGLATMDLDLCGVGPVTVRLLPAGSSGSSPELLPRPLRELPRLEAWTKVLATMEADPSERSRAAALVLRAWGLPGGQEPTFTSSSLSGMEPYARQLASMAANTRDVGVLQWAMSLCELTPRVFECSALSAEQLVLLEPDDGRHWLRLAAESPQRGNEALLRAVAAPKIGSQQPLLPAVDAALPTGVPPYIQHDLLMQAHAIGLRSVDGGLMFAAKFCPRQGGESSTICAALADALHDRGTDLITHGVGRALGERSGWPADRVAASRAAQTALMESTFDPLFSEQPFSCATVQSSNALLRDLAQFGELPAMRQMAAAAAASAATPR